MPRTNEASRLHCFFNYVLCIRVGLSIAMVSFLLVEDILEGVRPHDIDSFQDLPGTVGLFLIIAGLGLRSWAAGVIRKARALATDGPYALMRHPLYVGSLLIAVGFCLIIDDEENLWAILAIALALYLPKIHDEERSFAEKFQDEWKEYVDRVGMFSPKQLPMGARSDWSLTQWVTNREYRTCLGTTISLIGLELWHEFYQVGWMSAFPSGVILQATAISAKIVQGG